MTIDVREETTPERGPVTGARLLGYYRRAWLRREVLAGDHHRRGQRVWKP